MRKLFPRPAALALAALVLTGCSDDGNDNQVLDPAPADPVFNTLVFRFDDTINHSYTAADGLAWKGPFAFDASTGIITPDPGLGGPFPLLHDDGPASVGGHEAEGETQGDHCWTVAVQVAVGVTDWTFDYWPIVGSVDGSDGDQPWDGCGGNTTVPAGESGTLTIEGPAWIPPASGKTPVCFSIDDAANASYTSDDGLAWKGSFSYSPATRSLAFNGSWAGPFPLLFDDGPWTEGGHEGLGHTAGDHIWSVLVYVDNAQAQTWEYGAISGSQDGSDGTWIWSGANGTFTSPAGQVTQLDAPSLTLPASESPSSTGSNTAESR